MTLAACAWGQTLNFDAKPGLWEVTSTGKMSGMPIIDMSKMPPEARQRLEEAMKKQQTPQTRTTRSCMTREKLEKDMFLDSQQSSCKRTLVTNTRTVAEAKLECTNEKYPTVGTFRIEALSRENVKGIFKATAGPMNIDTTMTAKWISDNCGDVK